MNMKKIIYVIDDINYKSGAQKVTFFQMQCLQDKYDIYLLSLTRPEEQVSFLDEDHILGDDIWGTTELYAQSFKRVLRDGQYSFGKKMLRVFYALSLRAGMGEKYFNFLVKRSCQQILKKFDTIIVVSEASKLRSIVADLNFPNKIQWIHTDYARWSAFSEWTKAVTRYDHKLYVKFNHIVVLSEYCRDGLIDKIPDIQDKISVIPNLVDGDHILISASKECPTKIDDSLLNLVTVARLDREKHITKLFQIAKALKNKIRFKWYIIGDGPDRDMLEHLCRENDLNDNVEFLGYLGNPYPVMKNCDALVLLSKYEGTPVTIDEAMVLGIGIVAPKIGGIPEQVKGYTKCMLIEKDEYLEAILHIKAKESCLYDYRKKDLEIQRSICSVL